MTALFNATYVTAINAATVKCRKAVTQLTCISVFPACASEQLVLGNATIPLPRFPCFSACEAVNTACPSVGVEVACADAIEPTTGLPMYPVAATQFGPGVSVPCFASGETPPGKIPLDVCPQKFQYWPPDDQCLPVCPDAYAAFSDQQREILFVIRWVTTAVCIPLNIWLIVPYMAIKRRRLFPNYVPAMFILSHTAVVLAWTMGQFMHPNDWICHDAVHYRDRDDVACHIQGIFAAFTVVSTPLWFAVMSLNVLLPILSEDWMLGAYRHMRAAEVAEHVFAWGLPLGLIVESEIRGTLAIILPDLGYCTTADLEDRNQIIETQILFSFGNASGLVLIVIAVCVLMYRRFVLHLEWGFATAAKAAWKSTKNQLIFTIAFSVCATYFSMYTWLYWALSQRLYDELVEYSECNAQGLPDCEAEDILPFPLQVLMFLFGGMYVSISAFIIFGRNPWVLKFWKAVLRLERFSSLATAMSTGSPVSSNAASGQ